MGGSTSTTKSTQTNSAYAPVRPVIDQGAGIMQAHLNNPNANAVYSGPRVADLSGATQGGVNMLQQSAGANEAMDYYRGIMNSGAGEGNPQVAAMQDKLRRQAQAAANATFSNSGTTGGTQHQGMFAQGFTDAMAQPLFSAYENDRNRQLSAAGNLVNADQTRIGNQMNAGQVLDSHRQSQLNADMQAFQENRTAGLQAWNDVAPMATQIGSTFGTQNGTSVTKDKQSVGSMIGGGVMAGLGLMSGNPMAMGGLFGGGGASRGPSASWSWGGNGPVNFNEQLPWARG